jgi:hypothetical protein
MKWFIPLFVALLLIGVGCLTQPSFDNESVVVSTTMAVEGLTGVVVEPGGGEFDVLQLKLIDGLEEEVLKPGGTPSLERGALVRISGLRDLSTQQITASTIEVLNMPPVVVVTPTLDATVTSPLLVSGFLRAEDGGFMWRVRNTDGAVLFAAESTFEPSIGYIPFQLEAFLPAMEQDTFVFELETLEDATSVVFVPLRLISTKTVTFDLYFPSGKLGSNRDCGAVFPVSRTVSETSAVGRAALWQLLVGPTTEEKKLGYSTSIPVAAFVRSLGISDGTARVDFSQNVESGGSCGVQSIRAQIEKTLRQFDSVNEVIISSEGQVDTSL